SLVLQRRAKIVHVELRRLLRVVRLDVDVPNFHGHARLLRSACWVAAIPAPPAAWQHGAMNSTTAIGRTRMSTARDLASFLASVRPADLPAQALDHAAMLVASTLASAAMGSGLESA